jgi:hypothetical protein
LKLTLLFAVLALSTVTAEAGTTYPPGVSDLLFRPGTPTQLCYLVYPAICIQVGGLDPANPPVNNAGNEIDGWQIQLLSAYDFGSGPVPMDLTGTAQVEFFGLTGGNQFGTFNTQLLSMDATGTAGGHAVQIKLDPISPSTGQATIDNVGGQPMFHIDSFFDVFTEISLDSGPFLPAGSPVHVDSVYTPEPSTPIMLGAALILVASVWRRKRR